MSQSSTTNANPFGATTYANTNINATIVPNIRVGATTVYQVTIDNTNNSAISYLQCFDATTATVGTTAPNMILPCPATTKKTYFLDFTGEPFATALSLACTTTPTGAVNPASAVTVYVLCS